MVTHVSIKVSDGGHNLVEIDDFVKLPLREKMSLLTGHKLTFLDEQGNKVPLMEGVKFADELVKQKKS